jgi:hypothetical protein
MKVYLVDADRLGARVRAENAEVVATVVPSDVGDRGGEVNLHAGSDFLSAADAQVFRRAKSPRK